MLFAWRKTVYQSFCGAPLTFSYFLLQGKVLCFPRISKYMYTASRVSFYLPRKIGKRKETLLEACTIFDPLIIQKHGWVSPVSNQLYRFAPLYACLIIGFAVNVFAPTAYWLLLIEFLFALKCAITKVNHPDFWADFKPHGTTIKVFV